MAEILNLDVGECVMVDNILLLAIPPERLRSGHKTAGPKSYEPLQEVIVKQFKRVYEGFEVADHSQSSSSTAHVFTFKFRLHSVTGDYPRFTKLLNCQSSGTSGCMG